MIFGGLALFFNFVAVATIAFFFGVAAVSIGGLFHASLKPIDANSRRRVLWFVASIPWLLALGVSAFFLLSLCVDISWIGRVVHWHHTQVFSFYSWHAYPSLLLTVIFFVVFARSYRSAKAHLGAYHLLKLGLNEEKLLESNTPQAFSAGFLAPEVFISTGLINELDERELQIVRRHEQAHVGRRDSLKKLIFSFLSSFFPARVAQSMRQEMSLSMEQCADECVLSKGAVRADVAMTLLKVTRLMRAGGICTEGASGEVSSLKCAFGEREVKARVEYLMLSEPVNSVPPVFFAALLGTISILCLFSVDSFHHVIETLFNH